MHPPQPQDQLTRYDLGAMLKENPWLLRLTEVFTADMKYLKLHMIARATLGFGSFGLFVHIDCVNAVDYSLRPASPEILGGAPPVEYHEQHARLENISQTVPNTDGMDVYDPPVKFGVLIFDQSYVVAGQFLLRIENANANLRQAQVEALNRGLAWMESFRVSEPKTFPTRTHQGGE